MNFTTKPRNEIIQPVVYEEREVTQDNISQDYIVELSRSTTGWTPRTQVGILCEFIDSIGKTKELEEYLSLAAEKERTE